MAPIIEPCKNGRHRVQANLNNNSIVCKDCKLEAKGISFDDKVGDAFKKAERDWYIKELE